MLLRAIRYVRRRVASTAPPSTERLDPLHLPQFANLPRAELEELCRQRVQKAYLGDDRTLCRALGRYKLYVNTSDAGFTPHMLLDGYWELWVTQFIARTLKLDMVAIDVGAGIGYFALLMADAVGPGGRYVGIQPDAESAEILRSNIYVNGFMGRSEIIQSPLRAPATHLNALADKFPRVDFIRIDARGAEHDVIRGGERMLTKHKPRILMNFNPDRLKAPRELLQDLFVHYPNFRVLNHDGQLESVSVDDLLRPDAGDRYLYLARD